MPSHFITAIILTTFAGLSTTFGSVIAIFYKKPGPVYMTLAMGFSAGVMVLISFVELLKGGIDSIGFTYALTAFFIGMIVMAAIDIIVSHTYILEEEFSCRNHPERLKRTSILVALGIAIHNFPEGMATFTATLSDIKIGGALALAIAIHNIPEGIAVAAPIYAATGNRKKAFLWSFFSGASEPLGAIVAALILLPFLTPIVLQWVLCIVAGFMVYTAFDELLPVSRAYGMEHLSIVGVIIGMIVMTLSLTLF